MSEKLEDLVKAEGIKNETYKEVTVTVKPDKYVEGVCVEINGKRFYVDAKEYKLRNGTLKTAINWSIEKGREKIDLPECAQSLEDNKLWIFFTRDENKRIVKIFFVNETEPSGLKEVFEAELEKLKEEGVRRSREHIAEKSKIPGAKCYGG